jgi:putative ABC transport system substrate-binding protein
MEAGMKRRHLVLAASVVAMAPLQVLAQRSARIPTIGLLWSGFAFSRVTFPHFRDELNSRGYIEHKTIVFDSSDLVQSSDALGSAAEKLAAKKVDIIFAVFESAVRAAFKATQTIPIVTVVSTDPVVAGFAKSLARPGGNVTGVMYLGVDLSRKRLEILKDSIPGLRRVAVLTPPTQLRVISALQEAAATLGLTLSLVEIPAVADIDARVATVAQTGAQAILWVGGTLFGSHYPAVIEAVGKTRLPAIYPQSGYARSGGIMSYASSQANNFRLAAGYVDRILKGANPANLPFEQASKFEFVVNLKSAKAQGIRISETILLRATEVIE